MVMLAADPSVTTIEQLLALPEDGLRHELLRGWHVVTPSPRKEHQAVLGDFHGFLWQFTRDVAHLRTFLAPSDVRLEEDTLVQPDIYVVRVTRDLPLGARDGKEVPELVIEILSRGTARRDRGKKLEIYRETGVSEYWIVDIDSEMVERWRPGDERPEILRDKLTWQPDQDGAVLEIDLEDVFRRVGG